MKGNFAHHPVTRFEPFFRTCARCQGPTLRLSICGICYAVEFGMTDEQVHRELEILTDPRSAQAIQRRMALCPAVAC